MTPTKGLTSLAFDILSIVLLLWVLFLLWPFVLRYGGETGTPTDAVTVEDVEVGDVERIRMYLSDGTYVDLRGVPNAAVTYDEFIHIREQI